MWISPVMAPKQKQTLCEEERVFNEEWEAQYFLAPNNDKMLCLICDTTISCIKKYNAKLHYETHEKQKYFELEGEDRVVIRVCRMQHARLVFCFIGRNPLLIIFVVGFHCFEGLLSFCTLKDRTRGIDIFNAIKRNATKESSILLIW